MALLNFKYGVQSNLSNQAFSAGTIYITSDTNKLFVDNPHGTSGRICLGDFQLVSWTKTTDVTSPDVALANYSLKDTNTLYITVESGAGATAMWRYNGAAFVAISNSEEIADIVADIAAINTALEGKAPTNHAANANTYGLGTNEVYGHVKLTDAIDIEQTGGQASTGLAASAYAVKLAYDRGSQGVSDAASAQANAKIYTDEQISAVNSNISTLEGKIGNLSNIMNFLGTTDIEITDGVTAVINKPSAVPEDTTYTAVTGDVVVDSKGKECVYDGSVWRVIGDTSANSTAITALQDRMTTAEGKIDTLQADVGTDDGKGALFARVSALETWKGTHVTEYSNLNTIVDNHTTAIGASTDNASASGSLYARIKKNASDISGHATRISTLEDWKTSHANEYSTLAGRVTALETWKDTHTTAFNELSTTVSGNSTAINNLTTVLTWGTF